MKIINWSKKCLNDYMLSMLRNEIDYLRRNDYPNIPKNEPKEFLETVKFLKQYISPSTYEIIENKMYDIHVFNNTVNIDDKKFIMKKNIQQYVKKYDKSPAYSYLYKKIMILPCVENDSRNYAFLHGGYYHRLRKSTFGAKKEFKLLYINMNINILEKICEYI